MTVSLQFPALWLAGAGCGTIHAVDGERPGFSRQGRGLDTEGGMLYALHELQKTITAPLVAWADVNQRLFSSPYSPFAYHPLSRTIAASQEVLARLMRSYEKPAWRIEH